MRHALFSLLLAGFALPSLCGLAADEKPHPADEAGLKRIYAVGSVTVQGGSELTVEARGMVRTGGWTGAQLRPVKDGAADGVLQLEFVAKPPDGPASQAFAPISASYRMPKPEGFKEVRVLAETNEKTAK